jgi:hypothetical protein
MVDPKNPGAVDEILNFGEFWNDRGIRSHKEDILKTNKEIGTVFARAYKYLKAAYAIYQDSIVINNSALKKGELNIFTASLVKDIFEGMDIVSEDGSERSMFASAMTPKGLYNYLDNILTADIIYEIKGGIGTCEEKILEKVKIAALERGFYTEAFYCALNPYKLEHLIIPELNIALTTSNKYHSSVVKKVLTIEMNDFYDQNILESSMEYLNQNAAEFERLLNIALETISKAKALHDRLETYYIHNINFKGIDECFERTMDRILKG